MPDADFFGTNILIYAASEDERKASLANRLILSGGVISVQVLNEFVSVAFRKRGLSWPAIRTFLDGVRSVTRIVPLDEVTHDQAICLSERYKVAFFDALILASALTAGCDRLLSEDMHHGLVIDGRLRIENPFLG